MRIEEVTLLTILEGQKDADGFDIGGEAIKTELSATEMSVKVSDRIAGEHEGWKVSLKMAVDIDDYETAFIMDSKGRPVRPQKLIYKGVEYFIKDPVKNLETHEMELLCTEVEGWQSLPVISPQTS